MKSLVELQERSKQALAQPELVKVAANSSPNAAIELVKKKGFTEEEAQSCRYLAMILRDYGKEAFFCTVNAFSLNELRTVLNENVLPRIKLLETIAGDSLKIIEPKGRGLTLEEYLKNLPLKLDIRLALGDFKIDLCHRIKKIDMGSYESRYPFCSLKVAVEERELVVNLWTLLSEFNPVDLFQVQRSVLECVAFAISGQFETIYNDGYILGRFIKYLKAQGSKFLPCIVQSNNLVFDSIRKGDITTLEFTLAGIRHKALSECVSVEALAVFDFQADMVLQAARRKHQIGDKILESFLKSAKNFPLE